MTKEELLKKIKKIDLNISSKADEFFIGNYRSIFKGNGMEFSDIRKYEIGDDVKRIDWKTSARQRKTYIKEYEEERELSIFLLVDISLSNNFKMKEDLITQIAGSISYSATKNSDNVSLILFTDKIEKFIPPQKGNNHSLKIIEALLDTNPLGKGTDIRNVLNFFNKIQKRHSVVFLISDFLDSGYEETLKLIQQKHTVISMRIIDRKFQSLPKGFLFNLLDSESGETVIVGNLKEDINFQEEKIPNVLDIYTDEDYVKSLMKFFRRRSL